MMNSHGDEKGYGNNREWPPWVGPLLRTSFFGQCKVHVAAAHKGECNMFCLDCINGPLCSICLDSHKPPHRAIQIRRSSYHDVIRVCEIQKHMDITGVQTYIINSAKIVFLNQRPQQPRPPAKGVNNACHVCHRTLLDSFNFCSLGCKIAGTTKDFHKEEIIRTDNISGFGFDSDESVHSKHSKNRSSFTPSTPPRTAMMNFRSPKRRKGVPHRAPTGALFIEC
ncbi:hypothetical protein CASFOL_006538 [Castilleja foliolosa]|uniref:PLATZ transcription factor family protein n=1 Tax=Castilleja foliolosa TaxID=1961234 RepID=A0ABD3E6P0_9LAMI